MTPFEATAGERLRMSLLEVLYCDNHLLALNKPSGLLTQPSGTAEVSLEELGKQWLREEFHKPGAVFLEAVHRLDRLASGVVLFARTSKALTRLNAFIRGGQCEKIYLAVVEGQPRSAPTRLIDWLVHGDHQAVVATPDTAGAKQAVLEYQKLASSQGRSLLQVQLITGRYHQIRAQLANDGWPIVGDSLYGAKQRLATGGIALQHCHFRIPHPITRQWLDIKVNKCLELN